MSPTTSFGAVGKVKGGDYDAFSALFSKYRRRLAVLLRYKAAAELLASVEIDDVLQETFLTFNVHTLRLKNADYIDATAKAHPDLAIAGHLFARIEVQGDEMRVTPLNDEWLKKTVQAGLALPIVTGEDQRTILTAPTADLQRFVTLHAAGAEAWDPEASTFYRVH